MAGDTDPGGAGDDRADLMARLTEALAGLDPAEQHRVLHGLQAHGAFGDDPLGETASASRRRPRRRDVVTYRVRVDLAGTKPPLWRRLELASDLFLDEVHDVLQVAFGWTESHLHQFGCGPQYYSPDTEYYLGPFEVEEGDVGVPEHEVRLDEVLVDVGDTLFYAYDYGDDWHHTVRLEAVLPRQDAAGRAVCTAGRRPGPAEDCGGVYGYELIVAATDPAHPDHAEGAAEFARFYGDEVDPASFDTTPFDRDSVNGALADLGLADARARTDLPAPLADLCEAVRTAPARRRLRGLISAARLDEPVRIDADTAATMVRPYTWLLDRVGTDGIRLTGAGYLPPAHVAAAFDALGLDDEWIGKGNRETQTRPVLDLRESAQKTGLLRKHRGRLVLTARGRSLRADPVALWWCLAERMPPRSTDVCETQAGLLVLVTVAAQATDDLHASAADLLDAIGWMGSDGTRLTGAMAARAAWDTTAVLRRVGALTASRHNQGQQPTAQGVAFARAALRTWPDQSTSRSSSG